MSIDFTVFVHPVIRW